jgi:hypothetical protein
MLWACSSLAKEVPQLDDRHLAPRRRIRLVLDVHVAAQKPPVAIFAVIDFLLHLALREVGGRE